MTIPAAPGTSWRSPYWHCDQCEREFQSDFPDCIFCGSAGELVLDLHPGKGEELMVTPSHTRPRIPTDNEKYGNGFLASDDGGIWIVQRGNAVLYVATNRQAAEDAVYAKAEESGYPVDSFSIQVWEAQDQYPDKDDD